MSQKKFKQQNSVCAVLQKYVSAHILMSHDKCNCAFFPHGDWILYDKRHIMLPLLYMVSR